MKRLHELLRRMNAKAKALTDTITRKRAKKRDRCQDLYDLWQAAILTLEDAQAMTASAQSVEQAAAQQEQEAYQNYLAECD